MQDGDRTRRAVLAAVAAGVTGVTVVGGLALTGDESDAPADPAGTPVPVTPTTEGTTTGDRSTTSATSTRTGTDTPTIDPSHQDTPSPSRFHAIMDGVALDGPLPLHDERYERDGAAAFVDAIHADAEDGYWVPEEGQLHVRTEGYDYTLSYVPVGNVRAGGDYAVLGWTPRGNNLFETDGVNFDGAVYAGFDPYEEIPDSFGDVDGVTYAFGSHDLDFAYVEEESCDGPWTGSYDAFLDRYDIDEEAILADLVLPG